MAGAAEIVMRKTARTPVAIVRGAGEWAGRDAQMLVREAAAICSGSACGHPDPRTCESEGRGQRQFALGVGPQRHVKKDDAF